jgi:hypothetical protein
MPSGHHEAGRDTGIKTEPLTREALQTIVDAQVDKLIAMGFHENVTFPIYSDRSIRIQQTEMIYRQAFTVPEGTSQPPEYQGRFDTLVVLDPRVDLWFHLAKLADIWVAVPPEKITGYDHEFSRNDYRGVPARPYAIWTTCDTHRHMERVGRIWPRNPMVQDIRARLAPDEREGYFMEFLALCREHPELLNRPITAGLSRWLIHDIHEAIWEMPYIATEHSYETHADIKVVRSRSERYNPFDTMILGKKVIRLGDQPKRPEYTRFGTPAL